MPAPGQTQRAASKFIIFENFKRLNTQEVRQGLAESDLAWVENLQPIADNNWATVPGPGATLTSINQTINFINYGTINGIDYAVVFTTAGSAWAINIATGAANKFAPDGTFSVTPGPDMVAWQQQRFLFNDTVAGYSQWDGTNFTRQGGVSSNIVVTNGGTGYTSVPTVAITGGSGTGAAATATIGTPAVTAVILDSGGSGYSSIPTINFTGGGGSGASATVSGIDPRGVTSLHLTNIGDYIVGAPGYSITVGFSGGGGSGASATANLGINALGHIFVQSLTLNAAGSGYTSAPTVTFTPVNLTQITAATATCTVGAGQVLGINFNPATQGGSGYTSAPTVNFVGGSPTVAATAHAVVGGGAVTGIVLTNPGHGYLPSDVLTVTITGGGGTGATAQAHVAPLLPKGNSIAVFQGRVWMNFLVNGQMTGLQWSGTGTSTVAPPDDWNLADASGSLVLSDTDLVHQITGLRSFNNFLWIIGDQSIKQIGNISLNAAGNVTLFTILTVSSDQGTTFLRSCVSFNRVFFFVNQNGVYAVFGSSVQKISNELDGIFQNTNFTQQPQGALVDMTNVHCIMWLLRYQDSYFTNTTRSIFVIFNGQRWFVGSQGDGIVAVAATCTLASPNWVPMASSGVDLTPVFNLPGTVVTFRLSTALSHHQNPVQRKKTTRLGYAMTLASTASGNTLTLTPKTDEASQATTITLAAGFQTRTIADPNVSGTYLGYDMVGALGGFSLSNLRIEYQETNIGNQF